MIAPAALVSVLVVEDEILIAADLAEILRDGGLAVLGPCAALDEAMALLQDSAPDFAILDCDLAGVSSVALAHELRRRAIPFALLTGSGGAGPAAQAFGDSAILHKPFAPHEIFDLLASFGLVARPALPSR